MGFVDNVSDHGGEEEDEHSALGEVPLPVLEEEEDEEGEDEEAGEDAQEEEGGDENAEEDYEDENLEGEDDEYEGN